MRELPDRLGKGRKRGFPFRFGSSSSRVFTAFMTSDSSLQWKRSSLPLPAKGLSTMLSPRLLKKARVSGRDEVMEATGDATPRAVQIFLDSNLLLQRAIASHVGNLNPSSDPSLLASRRESQSKQAIPSRTAPLVLKNSCVLRQDSSESFKGAKIRDREGSFSRRGSC